ncbi:MAG: histidine ammonia-lyase [Candidatus Heimdallarchaeota archaeon]|nr:histidine ammonia-lyase [Candidatus Heimdallarchaeota archaeon]MCK5048437.1 histidine ammonia-lyase [Candidatus Heimdallarchaeota archaeon]
MAQEVIIEKHLTFSEFIAVARDHANVRLSTNAEDLIIQGRKRVEEAISSGQTIYGVNTGFGELSNVRISSDDLEELQTNIIRSHASGVGENLPIEVVRGAMLLLVNSLSKGNSGVRKLVVDQIVSLINANITPVVPSIGSLGASGDLAPLAHIVLVLLGEGKADFRGLTLDGSEVLSQVDLKPITLSAKEGLGLINGTHVMLSTGILAIVDSFNLFNTALIATSLSTDALHGTDTAFEERVHKLRPHAGQQQAAMILYNLLQQSEILNSHKTVDRKVQDAYSIRCAPQVLGATLDALNHIKGVLKVEMNSVTDNPLVLSDGTIRSAGHFHGQPLALSLDFLSIALAEIGNIAERRIDRLLNPSLSGLPAFLITEAGKNSGLMIAQYTAAALVSKNKHIANPCCTDSIPVSANKEDHVSMGMNSALKARELIENLESILAIELLCAAQGLEFHLPLSTSPILNQVVGVIREKVPPLTKDRPPHIDIQAIKSIIKSGSFVDIASKSLEMVTI